MGISTNIMYELANADGCVTIDELDTRLPQHARRDIIKAVGGLIARKLAAREYAGCYLVTGVGMAFVARGMEIKSGPAGPHSGKKKRYDNSFMVRVWEALRSMRKATTPELAAIARKDCDFNPEAAAARYLARWARAGFIVKLKNRVPGTAPTSNGFVQWYMVRDNGPVPPLWKPVKRILVDGNTGAEYTQDGVPVNNTREDLP